MLRPRLTELLQQNLDRKLTLISAPAGFGKTTLVSEWHSSGSAEARRLAWVTLDEGDNDPGRFLTYLISAIQTVEPGIGGRVLSLVQTAMGREPIPALTELINELGSLSGRLVLALDDYHVITSESVHHAVTFLLDRMPASVHMIITSRSDPPLPLPRLRAGRELVEIRAPTLRFTVDEATAFLNDVMGLNLTAGQVASIEARTEGWIAGLLLAALSAENGDDRDSLLETFSGDHRYIFDYLAEEVLRRQTPEIQRFLTRTAVLERMNGENVEAIAGGDNGQDTLEWLVRSNLFTIALDEQRIWYRYHHLFGEFLSSRFRQSDPAGWVAAHRRACEWFYCAGDLDDAVEHAIAAGDHSRLIALIEETGRRLVQTGQIYTLMRWLDQAGEFTCRERPMLCLLQAWAAMFDRRLDDADRWLKIIDPETLEPGYGGGGRADYALCQATYARFRGNIETVIQASERALVEFRRSGVPEDTSYWSIVNLHRGSGYRQAGEPRRAIPILTEAITGSWANGNRVAHLNALSELAAAHWNLGHFRQAEETAAQALRFEEENGLRPIAMTCSALLSVADIYRERNELEAADYLALTALEMVASDLEATQQPVATAQETKPPSGDTEDVRSQFAAYAIRTRTERARGRSAEAMAIASEAIERGRRLSLSPPEMAALDGLLAHLQLAAGDVAAAAEWAGQHELDVEDPISFHTEPVYLTFARLLIEQGRCSDARRLLDRLRQAIEDSGSQYRLAEADLLQAVLLDATGQRDAALALIADVVRRSEREGYLRIFLDTHPAVAGLLRTLRARESLPEHSGYIDSILEIAETAPDSAAGSSGAIDQSGLADPLTEREIEVLQLLATGLTNREIAGRIYVTVGTIKRHTHNIYGKLDAHSRTQAIVRGRELGLIE